MSATETLRAAAAAGVTVTLDGENLLLAAKVRPPNELIEALSRDKPAIMAFLCEPNRTLEGHDENAVLEWRLVEWLNQHPAPSKPGHCAWCGRQETPSAVVVPFGTEPGTHVWLHSECWRPWHNRRRADALVALLTGAGTPHQ